MFIIFAINSRNDCIYLFIDKSDKNLIRTDYMLLLAYTISPLLEDYLRDLDTLRRQILLIPLSPQKELALQWQTMVSRIHGSLALMSTPVSARFIEATLTTPKKSLSPLELRITALRDTLLFIRHSWTANPSGVDADVVEELAVHLFPTKKETARRALRGHEKETSRILKYVEAKPDHPVIMAATLHFAFLAASPIPDDEGLLARAVCALTLAKTGFDLRGMAAPEALFGKDPAGYQKSLAIASKEPTITSWLEYMAATVRKSYQSLWEEIEKFTRQPAVAEPPWLRLTDRQKKILEVLENPAATVTNRAVQKCFRVSQITASRDLARLTNVGLLYPHGKGRSIYYTKV